ncbi:unnamed protein product [Anisakis simplex]|uniref:RNA-binding protein pno-1 (inferred by orthology to a C. elegans protein) n=1 Tax=Anisakis simplex TaxID=6269 RepID=A0A0M3J184_ANISI|nr:unnamed protein product [Anisakis simplex]
MFVHVGKRKRKSKGSAKTQDVEMAQADDGTKESTKIIEDDGQDVPTREKRVRGTKAEIRKIPVPPHRYSPLKDNWVKIFTPIVKQLHLQIRFNLKSRNVEIRNSTDSDDLTNLQKTNITILRASSPFPGPAIKQEFESRYRNKDRCHKENSAFKK